MPGALRWPLTFARITRNVIFNLLDPPVLVLTYHRVTAPQYDRQFIAVTPDNFRAHLQYLKNRFPIVRFEDDWSNIKKPAVVITFDDGYADNVLEALPILEDIGVPATFFVSTGTINTGKEFWWDELERVVLGDWPFRETFELDEKPAGRAWPTRTAADREKLYRDLHLRMKDVDVQRRDLWLIQLRRWARAGGEGLEDNRSMTLAELQRLGRSKWATIGAHGINHTQLSLLSVTDQRKEIEGSKMQLETWTGQEIKVFSYPYGLRCDYKRATVDLCRQAGFIKAAANFPGQWHRWTDPYQIPRLVVRNWPIQVFEKHLRRFWIV
jgi:peptidoglycan/xylan/chitin deacetylase (PgdA/CDA1 family)